MAVWDTAVILSEYCGMCLYMLFFAICVLHLLLMLILHHQYKTFVNIDVIGWNGFIEGS